MAAKPFVERECTGQGLEAVGCEVMGIGHDVSEVDIRTEGSVMHVYLSPDHAGRSAATLASWYVDDVEGVVDELTERGVAFERYHEGPIITDEKGIATFEENAKVAYFRDPDGNTLSIATEPCS